MFKKTSETTRTVNGKPETPVRNYRNSQTGTEFSTYLIYTDRQGNKWWTFEDLFMLPMIRQMAAKKVLDLFGHGLALDDILSHTAQLKGVLKSTDPERYEKAYAKVLELESLSKTMADPVKQCIGLCTVYLLLDHEDPQVYNQNDTNQKLSILTLDIDAQAFFLTWWTGIMQHSGTVLKGLSRIASTMQPQKQ